MDLNTSHNNAAPVWALAMVLFLLAGLSTTWFNLGNFWNGYVLDICGPAWAYILIRGLFTAKVNNWWTRFFTPTRTFLILFLVSTGIEVLQFFDVYDATFDPYDLIAYNILVLPAYTIDRYFIINHE